jgi:hypothetical protein
MKKLGRRKVLTESAKYGALAVGVLGLPRVSFAANAPRMRKPQLRTVKQILTDLNLTTNLKLCLDAGDKNSYTSGDSWLDVSGTGFDFYLGSDATTAGDEPTFNGQPDGRSGREYFSLDGGDYFRSKTVCPAWLNTFHKDNAKFTITTWMYFAGSASSGICGNALSGGTRGFNLCRSSSAELLFQCMDESGTPAKNLATTGNTIPDDQWSMVTLSLDESGGAVGSFMAFNKFYTLRNGSYTAPSTNDSVTGLGLAAKIASGGAAKAVNGCKMAMMMMWQTNLSQADVTKIYQATSRRFSV